MFSMLATASYSMVVSFLVIPLSMSKCASHGPLGTLPGPPLSPGPSTEFRLCSPGDVPAMHHCRLFRLCGVDAERRGLLQRTLNLDNLIKINDAFNSSNISIFY